MKKYNLSTSLLTKIKLPEKGRIVLQDSQIAGLECRISSSGVKTFSVLRRISNGTKERITLGRFPTISVQSARKLAARVNDAIAEGNSPAAAKRAIKNEITFDDLFQAFLEQHAKVRKRTWKGDVGRYNFYLRDTIGKVRLSEIKKSDIITLHSNIVKSPRFRKAVKRKQGVIKSDTRLTTGVTANRILALINSIFNWGMSVELCQANPAARIKKFKEYSRERFLQADELPRFFKALEMEENIVAKDFILMCLLTGARRSNVEAMAWEQISFQRKEWTIPLTKNGLPQVVVLSDEAIATLKRIQHSASSSYVFPGEGKKGYLADPRKAWLRILERAELKDLRLHDLRRTLGSWQAKTGASLLVIGKSLGHKTPHATAIYSRLDLEPVRAAVGTATKAIYFAAKGKKIGLIFNQAAKKQAPQLKFSQLLG
ncbi:tyrosine-type recombinase/integrase [Flavobacterium sp.]|uniref:tyrosine-type recombinase/integrase n=1 Tax=Flavobacterium sp. TaxID=239 RepID=UPI0039E39465